jgi:hypothetical protein
VREFDPAELVGLIKDMAVAGELPSDNIPQLRQLLACVFGLLFASPSQQQQQQQHWADAGLRLQPSGSSNTPSAGR